VLFMQKVPFDSGSGDDTSDCLCKVLLFTPFTLLTRESKFLDKSIDQVCNFLGRVEFSGPTKIILSRPRLAYLNAFKCALGSVCPNIPRP
jgi:hypothetical protein